MDNDEKNFDAMLEERMQQLPKVVQDAITSADIEEHLRELANTHKLHLDQWEKLENEVMLALLGFQPADELPHNIEKEVGVDPQTAAALAADISHIVFQPVREELERQLEHPAAAPKQGSEMETMRTQVLAGEAVASAASPNAAAAPAKTSAAEPVAHEAAPSPAPATPPQPVSAEKVERVSVPAAYTGAPSHERKEITGDPYREQLS